MTLGRRCKETAIKGHLFFVDKYRERAQDLALVLFFVSEVLFGNASNIKAEIIGSFDSIIIIKAEMGAE